MILREVVLTTRTLCAGRPDAETEAFRQFLCETGCVCDLYRRCLPKLVTKETAKVLIDLSEEDHWVAGHNIQRLLNVTFSPWKIRFADFWAHSEPDRKQYALETLHGGLTWLATIEGWPTEPFDVARRCCLERRLVNEFLTKKAIPNPSKSARVRLFCEFGTKEARVTAVVHRGQKELGRTCLGATVPEAYCVQVTLDSLRWIDDVTIQLQLDHSYKAPPTIHNLSSLLSGCHNAASLI